MVDGNEEIISYQSNVLSFILEAQKPLGRRNTYQHHED